MGERHVRVQTVVDAAPKEVYATLSDHKALPDLVEGLRSLSSLTRSTRKEGSKFAAEMDLGTKVVAETFVLKELRPGKRVVWDSLGERSRSLSFEMRPEEGGSAPRTRVLISVSYELPDGWKGLVSGPVVEQMVNSRARQTLLRLKELFTS